MTSHSAGHGGGHGHSGGYGGSYGGGPTSRPIFTPGQAIAVLTPGQLLDMGINVANVVHITGFTDSMLSIENARPQAVQRLNQYSILTWGGDHFNAQGFTVLVRDFLAGAAGRKVFAFRNSGGPDQHDNFKRSWSQIAQEFQQSFHIVEINAETEATRFGVWPETQPGGAASGLPGGAVRFFLLGRLAVKILGTKRVVALGGGGIVGCEMQCGLRTDSAQWSVFALSRGRREANPSLMDAAVDGRVELVRGVDPNEAQAFASGLPTTTFPPPPWAAPAYAYNPPPGPEPPFQVHGAVGPVPPPASLVPSQPVQLPTGHFKCTLVSCQKPSWNGQPNDFCSVRCKTTHTQAVPPGPTPAVVPANPGGAQGAAPVPKPFLNDNQDMLSTGFMPLANFIQDFTPSKTCEEYLRQDVQSVPSMAPTMRFIDLILSSCGEAARQKVTNGLCTQYPQLNLDKILAALIFTFEVQMVSFDANEDSEFYRQYNNTLRQRNPQTMRALAGYSHFLFSAVATMPAHQGTLWRGIRGDDAVRLAMEKYGDGMEINWSAWSSASVDRQVAKDNFAQADGTKQGLIMRIETTRCARNIEALSIIPREQERVIFPNTKFVVIRPFHMVSDGIGEIHLKELTGTFMY